MRRVIGGLLVAVALVMAACGGTQAPTQSEGGANQTQQASSGGEQQGQQDQGQQASPAPSDSAQQQTSASDENKEHENRQNQQQKQDPPQQAEEDKPARIGDPVRAGDAELTVLEVKRSRGDSFNRPDEGYVFLFVRLQIKNKGDGRVFYNGWDFSVRDKNGNETTDDFAASVALGNRRVLNAGEIAPGGKAVGWLAFQVPANDKAPVLIWRPGFFGLQEYEVVLAK